jgi:hypothetical protein
MVAHTYNPRYLRCQGRKIVSSRPAWATSETMSQSNTTTNKQNPKKGPSTRVSLTLKQPTVEREQPPSATPALIHPEGDAPVT